MKKFLLISLLVLIILVAGLGVYFYFFPKKAQNVLIPDIEQVEKISIMLVGDTARLDLGLRIENKGMFRMNIDSFMYRIKFDTLTILSRVQDLDIVLSPGDVDTLHLPVSLPFKRLVARIKKLQDRDSADITNEVRIVYSTVFGKKALPYKRTKRIGMPRPPKFELEKIEFIKRDKKTVFLNARVKMHNYGKIQLKVSDIAYTIKVQDLFTASGKDRRAIYVKPESVMTETFPIEIKFRKAFKTAWLVLTNNDMVHYTLRLTAKAEADNLGDGKTDIEISQSGEMELKK